MKRSRSTLLSLPLVSIVVGVLFWCTAAVGSQPLPQDAPPAPHDTSLANVPEPPDLKSVVDYATIIYIDPTTTTPGDGHSPATPLASWNDVSFQADTAYVQKRGTTDTITTRIEVNQENVLLGAYGETAAARPIIYDGSTNITYMLQVTANAVTVRELEIVSPRATSGIHFAAGYWPSDGTVWDCSVHGVDQDNYLMWGVRVFGERTRVLNSEIFYIGDDGIFVQYFPDIEIGYNRISRVNQKWFENPVESYASGDGIQFDSSDRFYIHHNVIDRSDTGNKFCIIVDPKGENATGGLIENNRCTTAKGRVPVFAGGATPYHIVIRNNLFTYVDTDGTGVGIWSHATQPEIYNNVFVNFQDGIALLNEEATAVVHHNTFYNMSGWGIWGGVASLSAHNNIFALQEGAAAFGLGDLTAANNLFVRQSQMAGSDPIVGNPQFVDAANANFHLLPDSDAIDAGTTSAGIPTDADGNPRDASPDIGAYEFQTASQLLYLPAVIGH